MRPNTANRHNNSCILLLLLYLTDGGASGSGDGAARYLGDRQQKVANQQTCDVVRLAAPVQHMVARGQYERSGQRGGEEHHGNEQSDGEHNEANVLYVDKSNCVPLVVDAECCTILLKYRNITIYDLVAVLSI